MLQAKELLERVLTHLKPKEPIWKEEWRQQLAEEVAYLLLYQKAYRWVRDRSAEPWDHSGKLVEVEGGLASKNLETFAELCQEHSGEQEPSFESGSGWNYPTFEHVLFDWTQELIIEQVTQGALAFLSVEQLDLDPYLEDRRNTKEAPPDKLKYLDEENHEPLMEHCMMTTCTWFEEAAAWELKTLFFEGEFGAKKRRREEEAQQRIEREAALERRKQAEAVHEKFIKLYESQYGPFHRGWHLTKTDAHWPAVKATFHSLTSKERLLLAGVLRCSNSITALLRDAEN